MAEEIYFLGDSNLNRMANQVLYKRLLKTDNGKNYYQSAISGQCSRNLANHMKQLEIEESTVLLMIGTNDALKKTNIRQYESALQAIFRNIRNKKVIFCNVLPVPRLQHPNHLIKNYNEIIRSFGPYANVTLIDVYSHFVSKENGMIINDYFEDDKLHLNRQGLHILWDLICDKI